MIKNDIFNNFKLMKALYLDLSYTYMIFPYTYMKLLRFFIKFQF